MKDPDDPLRWLGDAPMLNLGDDKLRLRVQTVTQFARNDVERRVAICRYVAAIPFNVPAFASMKVSRKTLSQRQAVGWYSKAALFQAMLRVANYPSRIRMIRVGPKMYRGLAKARGEFALPVVEVWTGQRWCTTDSYVYDPSYLAAAREAVQKEGWRSGYGVHLDGQMDWDGESDALVMIMTSRGPDGTPQEFLDVYDNPQSPGAALRRASRWRWWMTMLRNRLMSMRMNPQVRRLRREAGG